MFLGSVFSTYSCVCLCVALLFVQHIVKQWQSYALEVQQELFDAALLVASRGAWGDLQDDLQLVLDLAAG